MNKIRLGQNNLNVRVIVFLLLSLLTATLLKFENVYAFPEELPVSYPAINSSIVEKKNRLKRVNEQYIIKFRESSTEKEKEDFLTGNGLPAGSKGKKITTVKRKIENYNKNIVEIIEEDGIIETESTNISDPLYKEQWYLEAMSFKKVIENSNLAEKTVAVIDSGVCLDHPDLQGKILGGWNFVDDNSDVTDTIGHGCFISGIIGAGINNKVGIAGAGVNVKILSLKVIGENGLGNYSDLIEAIDYAVAQNVDVINISLGGLLNSQILHQSILEATSKGIKVVASAGNTANTEVMYPARFSEVISVGSVENDYTVSDFSSSSPEINLWAYGTNIITTDKNGDYAKVSGTSIAAAEVSAFIANGGEYGDKSIISYVSKVIKPVFKDNYQIYKESISGLTFEVPSSLESYGFENINPDSFIINWQKVVYIAQGETMAVTVWDRESKDEIQKVFKTITEMDGCKKLNKNLECVIELNDQPGQNNGYSKYFIFDRTLIRVMYSYNKLIGIRNFINVALTIKINSKFIFKEKDFKEIKSKVKPDVIYPQVGTQTCGDFTDPLSNPYECCSNGGNCTWYASYKRPDLKGIISLWPEGLWGQALAAGIPTNTNQPVVGALIVWKTHVAYVESFDNNTPQVTWSEQNCGGTAYKSSVTYNTFTPNYVSDFLGYILFKDECNGSNVTMSNWNVKGSKTCNASGSLTVNPESTLDASNGEIILKAI